MSTLSDASASCFFCAPGMTHAHVAEGPDDGLGLAVGLISRFRCHKFWERFLGIANTNYSTSAISGIPAGCRKCVRIPNDCMLLYVAADYTPFAEAVDLSVLQS